MKKLTQTIITIALLLPAIAAWAAPDEVSKPFTVGESTVHRIAADDEKATPVIMVPGLGLGASIYLKTPDGRDGWADYFADANYAVYVIEFPSPMQWPERMIWRRWGLGEQPGKPHDNTRFPINHMRAFMDSLPEPKQQEPSQNTQQQGGRRGRGPRGGGQNVADVIELLKRTGPAVVLCHSMGGATVFEAARKHPKLVKALIAIEPVGAPTKQEDIQQHFAKIPYVTVYGDYIAERGQTGRYEASQEAVRQIQKSGGKAKMIELTKRGIHGNTHLMMLDDNNKHIAELILDWLKKVK
ncbi:hypothetical protein GF373_05955 [bacterium]|nr:hypothetical protein [bacterium]